MSQPEAFSRILIDKALEFSGWDLLKPQQIQFELHTGNGRADYLLKDSLGRVLCVLEAKRDEGPNSYRVPIEKIRENDWSLAAGRYKPVTTEAVNHDKPQRIVAEALAIEARITAKLTRLQGMVK